MSLLTRGYCLSSQSIRERILNGLSITPSTSHTLTDKKRFTDKTLEGRIQPASRDTFVGDELFILDTEGRGLFEPPTNKSVYRALLELPMRQRQRVNISRGFEIKKGFTYLMHLEDKEQISAHQGIKSSPKSTYGRLFLNSRMLADFNPCFDQISSAYRTDTPLDLWLLCQPLAFNGIIHPGISLSQLRFFEGYDAKLSNSELFTEHQKTPILYTKGPDGTLIPAPFILTVNGGLQLHLDAEGRDTNSVIGLRARKNPNPIDFAKKGEYRAEDFFQPLLKGHFNSIQRNEYYLMASKEIFMTPNHLSIELVSTSEIGFTGLVDFAGFVDNSFKGGLVFEIESGEPTNIAVSHNKPISAIDVFWTDHIPDKLYGEETGSTYHGQIGPRPSSHFQSFNFDDAARNVHKMNRHVLIQDAKPLRAYRHKRSGFEYLPKARQAGLEQVIHNGFFQNRYDCEEDELAIQPVPYIIIFGPDGNIFTYIRAKNQADYGDTRLFGKISIGVGGHIALEDEPDYLLQNIERELSEEITYDGTLSMPKLVGTLMAHDKPVDRTHFALIYVRHASGEVRVKEAALKSGQMRSIDFLQKLILNPELIYEEKPAGEVKAELETWTRLLIPHLPQLYKIY